MHHNFEQNWNIVPMVAEGRGAMPRWLAYGAAFAASIAAAWIGEVLTAPHLEPWYALLVKPAFTPPNAVFPIVWPILYALMALAAGRVASLPHDMPMRRRALIFYGAQLVLNVVWSFAFFARESPPAGMLAIVILLAAILSTVILFWQLDRPAAILMLPYLAWAVFAAVLNAAILALN
jgi:translocator protein